MHVFGNGHPVLSSPPGQVSSSCEQTIGQKAGQLPVVAANYKVLVKKRDQLRKLTIIKKFLFLYNPHKTWQK